MKMLLPIAAVVLAVPAAAQASDMWPVAASGGSCSMTQTFHSSEFGRHTLVVGYDAARKQVTLDSTNPVDVDLPDANRVDLRIVFLDNGEEPYDIGWGTRTFAYSAEDGEDSEEGEYRFSTEFSGERNVRQILADLGASRSIGLMSQGKLVIAYDLAGARASIARLRECATKAMAAN